MSSITALYLTSPLFLPLRSPLFIPSIHQCTFSLCLSSSPCPIYFYHLTSTSLNLNFQHILIYPTRLYKPYSNVLPSSSRQCLLLSLILPTNSFCLVHYSFPLYAARLISPHTLLLPLPYNYHTLSSHYPSISSSPCPDFHGPCLSHLLPSPPSSSSPLPSLSSGLSPRSSSPLLFSVLSHPSR